MMMMIMMMTDDYEPNCPLLFKCIFCDPQTTVLNGFNLRIIP